MGALDSEPVGQHVSHPGHRATQSVVGGGKQHGRLNLPVRLAELRRILMTGPQVAAPDHREVLTLPGIAVYTQ
ncbi:MAG: hypothetical protein ACPG6K_02365 [Pseudohongiellaceae bacterium]